MSTEPKTNEEAIYYEAVGKAAERAGGLSPGGLRRRCRPAGARPDAAEGT